MCFVPSSGAHTAVLYLAYVSSTGLQQIIPAFTADAWGGPSYLGALYCHTLDIGLITAVAGRLADRLMLSRRG